MPESPVFLAFGPAAVNTLPVCAVMPRTTCPLLFVRAGGILIVALLTFLICGIATVISATRRLISLYWRTIGSVLEKTGNRRRSCTTAAARRRAAAFDWTSMDPTIPRPLTRSSRLGRWESADDQCKTEHQQEGKARALVHCAMFPLLATNDDGLVHWAVIRVRHRRESNTDVL